MTVGVCGLRSVEIAVTDPKRALDFYTRIWGLASVAEHRGAHFLRATGPIHHVLVLRPGPQAAMRRIVLDAPDRPTVDALAARLSGLGIAEIDGPATLGWPGGGYGFGFVDPEGRNFAVVCGVADLPASADDPDRPRKLSHVNLNSGDNEPSYRVLSEGLGFRLSDQTGKFRFLRCNTDHHSLVLGFNEDATLNHIAFEMPDLDGVMRGAGRLRDHGYPIEWGPGRHGPGRNVFCYFCGPEEMPLEYTSDMDQVDETYRTGMPSDWTWPPRRVDRWGVSDPPSLRVQRAQALFRFVPGAHRLDA